MRAACQTLLNPSVLRAPGIKSSCLSQLKTVSGIKSAVGIREQQQQPFSNGSASNKAEHQRQNEEPGESDAQNIIFVHNFTSKCCSIRRASRCSVHTGLCFNTALIIQLIGLLLSTVSLFSQTLGVRITPKHSKINNHIHFCSVCRLWSLWGYWLSAQPRPCP